MESSDVFGSSTATPTWQYFLERMRHPSAADFVKAIKSFIVSFLNNTPDVERDSTAVQEFLGNMELAFRSHSLWAGCSEEELESAGEGLEKYVMTKLFTRVFAVIPEDVEVDKQLHEKMALIQQFIRPENLDIKPTFQNETSWLLAQKELQKINMYKAPRDKLVCILNCCKVINNLLINASIAASEDHPGADEFLPVLIYVTVKVIEWGTMFISIKSQIELLTTEEAGELPKQLLDKVTSVVTPNDVPPAISLSNQKTTVSSTKPKYRHEFYQKPEEVVVTIFAKGIPADKVVVDFGEQILSVTINVPGEEAYCFQPRLFGKINPAKCRYDVMSTKIEIRLAKVDAVHWTSLEYSNNVAAVQITNAPSGNQRPTYPSSKPKRVDWDKLEAQVKNEEKEEKLDGDAALNKFFRDIYKDSDEDTRRAMSKSFVESNGTVLSTNWKEVGLKKVEGSPPDGMELKQWEY